MTDPDVMRDEIERLKAQVAELEALVQRHVKHAETYYSICRMCGSNADDLAAYVEWLTARQQERAMTEGT